MEVRGESDLADWGVALGGSGDLEDFFGVFLSVESFGEDS